MGSEMCIRDRSDFGARFGSRYQNKNIRRYLRGPFESRIIGSMMIKIKDIANLEAFCWDKKFRKTSYF